MIRKLGTMIGLMAAAVSAQSELKLYRCADGSMFQASFLEQEAQVRALGRTWTLKQETSGSGVRYGADGLVLLTKGTGASIERDGKRIFEECDSASGAATGLKKVAGLVTYRELMALPPGSTLKVTLADVSRADARATILGEITVPITRPVPIPFEVEYDAGKIDPRMTYAVSARIMVGDKLTFITDTRYPVITGHPARVNLVLKKLNR